MQNRKHNIIHSRQNQFIKKQDQTQQQLIKENKDLEHKLKQDGNLKASTLVEGVAVCLYAYGFFYGISKMPRAEATSGKSFSMHADREIEMSRKNESISNPVDSKLPRITQSKLAMKIQTPENFRKDTEALAQIIQSVRSKNRESNCRAQSVFGNPNFHIVFRDPSELAYGANAEYDSVENNANFIVNQIQNKYEKEQNTLNFIHEVLAHAFVREQNRVLNTRVAQNATPYSSPVERKLFIKAVNSGLKELRYRLKLFDKKLSQLTDIDKIKLNQLKAAGLKYEPALELLAGYGLSEEMVDRLIQSGNLDKKTYQLKKPLKLLDGEISIYCHSLKKADDGEYYCYTNVNDGVSDKGKVALLELLNDLSKIKLANYPEVQSDAETDAYIQEHLLAYPVIFSSIFSELSEYHYQRGDQVYQNCMKPKLK